MFWLKRETSLSAKWINSLPPCYIIWNPKIVIVRENIAKKSPVIEDIICCLQLATAYLGYSSHSSQYCRSAYSLKLKKKKNKGKNERVGEKGASKSAFAAGSYEYKQPYNTTILHWNFHIFVASLSFCCWYWCWNLVALYPIRSYHQCLCWQWRRGCTPPALAVARAPGTQITLLLLSKPTFT